MVLGLAAVGASGCLRNYSIESPNVSVVLAQAAWFTYMVRVYENVHQ